MQKQWQLIKQFPLPTELKDSIVYLQRALRDFVTQHQILASKIKILPINQRAKIKECMRELEQEMRSIGEEQEGLVRHLSERVKRFQLTVQSQKLVTLAEELLCGYVAQQLNYHNETAVFNVTPKHISPRMNASELAEKYCLETILAQTLDLTNLDVADDDSILLNDPWATGAESKPPSTANNSNTAPPKTYLKESPIPSTSSRSLLKTKQDPSPPASIDRPFAAVAKRTLPKVEPITTPEKSSDDEPEDPLQSSDAKASTVIVARTGGVWVPGLRGRPPKGVKYVPAAKLAAQEAQRQVAPPKRSSKRKEVLEEKIELIELDQQDDSGEEEDDPPAPLVTSAAVRRGRSNLLQALNKQKRGPGRPSASELLARNASTAAAGPKRAPGGSKLAKHASYASSGSSPNSRSSTPTWGMRQQAAAGSDDSCDRRSSSIEQLPSLPDPGEPPVPTPATIYELGQASYLRYFGLYTPDEAKALKERKRERKRRSCYSTERKDFHYGKLDYYEQQQQYQVARATKRQNQRPILYSPPVAVAKKRKHPPPPTQQQSSSSSSSVGRPRLPPANIFAAMDIRSCFVCYKTGTTDELSACMNCCNIYHLDCHKIDEQDDAYRQRDNLCPVCLTTDEGDK
uniref:PHD-type domain-containing protein n=1 Tax=Anopheles dirus TaxID=7168 RepID=A0A182MYJ5_9DIPT